MLKQRKNETVKGLFVLVILLSCASISMGATATFNPTADTFVSTFMSNGGPDSNHDADATS